MEAGQAGFAICVIITVALAHVASASATPTKELGGSRPAVLTRSPQYVRGGHALSPPPLPSLSPRFTPHFLGHLYQHEISIHWNLIYWNLIHWNLRRYALYPPFLG